MSPGSMAEVDYLSSEVRDSAQAYGCLCADNPDLAEYSSYKSKAS